MTRSMSHLKPASLISLGLFLLASYAFAQASAPGYRLWSDASGRFQTEAELLVFKDGTAYLKKKDGKVVGVPVERLSQGDRQYLVSIGALGAPIGRYRAAAVVIQREADAGGSYTPYVAAEPAVVVFRDDRGAYVLASSSAAYHRASSNSQDPTLRYRVTLGAGTAEQVQVDAELAGFDSQRHLAVWRIPGEKAPEPIPLTADLTVEQATQVTVFGCQVSRGVDNKPSFGRSTRRGTVSSVLRDRVGRITDIRVSGDGVADLPMGVAVDSKGRVLGIAAGATDSQSRRHTGRPATSTSSVSLIPLSYLASLRTPRVVQASLSGQSWNAEGITYQVSAKIDDPFGRAEQAFLLLKRRQGEQAPTAIDPTGAAAVRLDVPPPTGVTRSGSHPPLAEGSWREQFPVSGSEDPQYVAALKTVDADGKELVSPAIAVPARYGEELPYQIGSFLQMASRARPHPKGGLLLTANAPLPAAAVEQPADGRLAGFPLPEEVDVSVAGPPHAVGKSTAVALSGLGDPAGGWQGPAAAVWSREGKHVYILHGSGLLRKIAVPELREVRRLTLPVEERRSMPPRWTIQMALSREGLVVNLLNSRAPHDLWIIDEKDLHVKHRVSVPSISLTTAPSLSTAYLIGDGLQVVDLAAGKIVRDSRRPAGPHGSFRESVQAELIASPDGSCLLAVYNKYLLRLAIECHDLVFEQASKLINARAGLVFISGDSKRVFAQVFTQGSGDPTHPGLSHGIYVYELANLSAPKRALELPEDAEPLAVDPVSDNLCIQWKPGSGQSPIVGIFSPELEELERFPFSGFEWSPAAFRYHPLGGALLARVRTSFVYIRLPWAGPQVPQVAIESLAEASPSVPEEEMAQFVRELPHWVEDEAPSPTTSKELLLGETTTSDGLTLTNLVFSDRIRWAAWSADGAHIFTARTSHDMIQKIDADGFRDVVQIQVPGSITRGIPAFSEAGLVVKMGRPHRTDRDAVVPNLLLVDADSLQIKRAFFIEKLWDHTASPGSPWCLAWDERGDWLLAIDLATGKPVSRVTDTEVANATTRLMPTGGGRVRVQYLDLENIFFAADGKTILLGGNAGFCRLGTYDGKWYLNGVSADGAADGVPRATGDPQYVCLFGRQLYKSDASAVEKQDHYRIYAIDDLSEPSAVVPRGQYSSLAMDPKKQRIYTTCEGILRVYDYHGKKRAEYELSSSVDRNTGMTVDPKQGRLLMRGARNGLYLVEVPD